jgi:hypothetical protein
MPWSTRELATGERKAFFWVSPLARRLEIARARAGKILILADDNRENRATLGANVKLMVRKG